MADLWSWLNTPPTVDQVLDPFGVVYLVVFLAGFVASAYFNGPHAEPLARNPIQRAGIVHWSNVGLWVFGPGLFFFGVAALQINPLSFGEPIWLVGSVIAAAIAGVRCVEWWRSTYPALLAEGRTHAVNGRELDNHNWPPSFKLPHGDGDRRQNLTSDFRLPTSDS